MTKRAIRGPLGGVLRLGFYLGDEQETSYRRATGFMKEALRMEGMEAITFQKLALDLGDLPEGIHGLAGSFLSHQLPILEKLKIPLVSMNDLGETAFSYVLTDWDAFSREVISFLLERGFREIAFFRGKGPENEHTVPIFDAINRRALKQQIKVRKISHGGKRFSLKTWNLGHVLDDLGDQLKGLPKRTSVICSNDWFGNRVIMAAKRAGIEVPGKLGVLGIDNNILYCETIRPTLSSVALEQEGKGARTARLLVEIIRDKTDSPKTIRLPAKGIIARESTGFFRGEDPAVKKALALMDQSDGRKPNLSSVARASGMSLRTLHRKISEATGKSPGAIARIMRVEKALSALRETDLPLAEVAVEAGYSLPSQMSREVKHFTGHPPSQYRSTWR